MSENAEVNGDTKEAASTASSEANISEETESIINEHSIDNEETLDNESLINSDSDSNTTEDSENSSDKINPNEEKNENEIIEYADFQFPEGVEADKNFMGEAIDMFKGSKLPQEKAQEFVDLGVKIQQETRQADRREWDKTTANWTSEVKNDSELGGRNFKQTIKNVNAVIQRFDTDGSLTTFLSNTKAGNHPGMIRFLHNVYKNTSEDQSEGGGGTGGKKYVSDADLFFPNG